MADRRPLISESSDSFDAANTTPALPSLGFSPSSHSLGFNPISQTSPHSSPPLSRPGYARLQSDAIAVERNTPSTVLEEDEDGDIAIADSLNRRTSSGLGIASPTSPASRRVSIQTIPRRPVPAGPKSPPLYRSPATLSPPGTGNPLLGGFPRGSVESTPDLTRGRYSPDGGSYDDYRPGILKNTKSSTSLDNDDYQQYLHSQDSERLRRSAPSIKSAYETGFRPTHECPTTKDFYQSRFTWVSITIVIICLFSTVFSGIFLGLALKAPRYGRRITSHGPLHPADAMLLTSVFAKLIELSFVTSFVAFLGQVLSRRAFMKEQGRGVTLSELSMWRWVVQPGTLITHWETAKYAGISILGILSLLSAVLATMYTSAATALVQPILRSGNWDHLVMQGRVVTEFANVNYVKELCESPITAAMDPAEGGNTCLQIEHAGQGYHNYQRYLSSWEQESRFGNGTSDQSKRPQGFGLLYENTTVFGQWINIIDTKEESKKYGRAYNKVALAMPHAGVFAAARDERNNILQPEELSSEGTYSIRASVPSPVLNVLCVNMNRTELEPIVYDSWSNNETVLISNWKELSNNATTTNKTVVDDIFGWTKQSDAGIDYPPVFSKFPVEFNTVMNHTSAAWGRDAIYLLGAGGAMGTVNNNQTWTLCKMHVTLTAKCATQYNATGSGGTMEAICEDKDADMSFIHSNSSASEGLSVPNWRDVGFDWSNSMSLNTGIMDANAANSRLLTQLILHNDTAGEFDLNPTLPSPAEALAVMSGCTLLMSALDAPYIMDWNYTAPKLGEYTTQYFNASVTAQQYASGGVDDSSKGWMIILFLVFLMNILVLIYFLFHKGLVTDFSEPPNLFALAVNSPPSHLLAGSCGGGPEGKQYMVNWFVNAEGDHLYMEPGQKPVLVGGHDDHSPHTHTHHNSHAPHVHVHPPSIEKGKAGGVGGFFSGITNSFGILREGGLNFGWKQDQRRMRPVSVVETEFEMDDAHTKTQRRYQKLANRRSML
ncbi:hypothetical protein K458DRAFT_413966 [Lentithecium fluviatile CBS 122367]|uniref:Uncharacterized protein n=1 Tax=Lentithecium fluviatile CBS 122367 TaxID=1168545 RepID=A0A6G1JHM0_9PLEO|nr:hypothetical protein K458DRAFT_413966 [Lentithecium fluviatile CBS 122367]